MSDSSTQSWELESNTTNTTFDMSGLPSRAIFVLLHGDVDVFDPSLLKLGFEGGKVAAQQLHFAVKVWLSKLGHTASEYKIACSLFYNRFQLAPNTARYVDFQRILQFLQGFNATEQPFLAIDAGSDPKATQKKLGQYLDLFARPGTDDLILLGGLHDAYNAHLLLQLPLAILKRVTLLQTCTPKAPDFNSVPEVGATSDFQYLFEKRFSPSAPYGCNLKLTTQSLGGGGAAPVVLQAPQAPVRIIGPGAKTFSRAVANSPYVGVIGQLTARALLPLPPIHTAHPKVVFTTSQQSTTPAANATHACNEHYLRPGGCSNRENCMFDHQHVFTAEEWAALPERARRIPCKSMKREQHCAFGNSCCYGHFCPELRKKCPHGRACWFSKAGMPHRDG